MAIQQAHNRQITGRATGKIFVDVRYHWSQQAQQARTRLLKGKASIYSIYKGCYENR